MVLVLVRPHGKDLDDRYMVDRYAPGERPAVHVAVGGRCEGGGVGQGMSETENWTWELPAGVLGERGESP